MKIKTVIIVFCCALGVGLLFSLLDPAPEPKKKIDLVAFGDTSPWHKLVNPGSIWRDPHDRRLAIADVCNGRQSSCEFEPEMWVINCSTGYITMRDSIGVHDGDARLDSIFARIMQYVCQATTP
jgi:hypothetical protein